MQLVVKGKTKECVVCGGTGTGIDGVYALLLPDTVETHHGNDGTRDMEENNTSQKVEALCSQSSAATDDGTEDDVQASANTVLKIITKPPTDNTSWFGNLDYFQAANVKYQYYVYSQKTRCRNF